MQKIVINNNICDLAYPNLTLCQTEIKHCRMIFSHSSIALHRVKLCSLHLIVQKHSLIFNWWNWGSYTSIVFLRCFFKNKTSSRKWPILTDGKITWFQDYYRITRTYSLIQCFRKLMKWKLSTITPAIVKRTTSNSGYRLMRKNCVDWNATWGKHMKSSLFKVS